MTGTFEGKLVRKIVLRTIPLLALMYIISFLDRVNIGYAALTMNKAIGISPVAYGSAAGVFFLGYLLFQIPANLMIVRLGARRWMALIMLVWGCVAAAMAAVTNDRELISARFLLGVAEAGFFPGAILYLTIWFPPQQRARIVSYFMFAAPIAYIVGGPVSGLILDRLDGWKGLAGWQWLFVAESLPAILLAPFVLKYLPAGPQEAPWLSDAERSWQVAQLKNAQTSGDAATASPFGWPLIACALAYCGLQVGVYGIGLWLPQIISGSGLGPLPTSILGALPYLFAAFGMLLWGGRGRTASASDVWLPTLGASLFLALSVLGHSFVLQMCGLTAMTVCLFASLPMFWAYCTSAHASRLGPLGIALVNAAGSLGGFLGPQLVGWIKSQTASFVFGLLCIAGILAISGLTILVLGGAGRMAQTHPDRSAT